MHRIRLLEQCKYVMISLSAIVFILTNEIKLSSANSITFECTEPTDVKMWEMYRKFREHELQIGRSVGVTHNPTATQNTIVNTSCSGAQTSKAKGNAWACECPSKDEITFDPERIPKAIAQTSCCKVDPHPSQDNAWVMVCYNVYQDMRVFRRNGCKDGVYTYEPRWEKVPIGCSCSVHKNVVASRH